VVTCSFLGWFDRFAHFCPRPFTVPLIFCQYSVVSRRCSRPWPSARSISRRPGFGFLPLVVHELFPAHLAQERVERALLRREFVSFSAFRYPPRRTLSAAMILSRRNSSRPFRIEVNFSLMLIVDLSPSYLVEQR